MTKTKAIAAPEETAIAVPETLKGVLTDDLITPRRRIVQPISKEGTAGKFRDSSTGAEYDEIVAVPLAWQRGRVLWGEVGDDAPLCRSNDGLTPDPSVDGPRNDVCTIVKGANRKLVCSQAGWDIPSKHRCAEVLSFLFFDIAEGTPFFMPFSKSALRAGRTILSTAKTKGKDIFEFVATMTLKQGESDKGKYFVPVISVVPVDEPGQYRDLYDEFAALSCAADDEIPF